jgi:phenylacetate-CoA ligase
MGTVSGKAHDWLSLKVLTPFSYLRRTARRSRRPVMHAFREGMRFRREAANWTEDQRREWILSRLQFAVRRAYRDTDYYRELFNGIGFDPASNFTFDDYALLPILERDDVQRRHRALISNSVPEDLLKRDATGGSTGKPTEIWMGPEESGWSESGGETFFERLGVPTGTRTGLLWGHHLDPVTSERLRDRYYAFANNIRWFDCFRLSPEVLDRYHAEFSRWKPACIIAYASALASLAEHLKDRGIKPEYPTRCLITGAEKLFAQQRRVVDEVFGRPLYERYGSRDVGCIGYQTDAQDLNFEVDWANVLLEPETSEPESAILITKLHGDGMPMLRYRIGDIGRFDENQRPGHPTFALTEVVGRDTERIWLPDGRWIHGIQIPHLMKDFPVREFMFVQDADYSIELKLVPRNGFEEHSRAQILSTISANLPGVPLSVTLVDDIPRTRANKWRPVVSAINELPAKAL